jgi:hypothetical protein
VRGRFAQENSRKLKEWSNEQAFVRVFELNSGYRTIDFGARKSGAVIAPLIFWMDISG